MPYKRGMKKKIDKKYESIMKKYVVTIILLTITVYYQFNYGLK